MDIEDVLNNNEMRDLISCIGVGVNDYHNMSEVRYGKVIICADADPDGKNISALCLGAIAHHMTFLIELGYVYVALTPLFVYSDGEYCYFPEDLDKRRKFARIKGLGELNPEELEPCVFDENKRQLVRITLDNWEKARDLLCTSAAKRRVMIDRKIIRMESVSFRELL